MAAELLESDILSLNQNWWLRNDGNYLVLYKLSANESISIPLPPPLSIFVALLGGGIPVKKLVEEINFVLNLNSLQKANEFILSAVNFLSNNNNEIVIKNEAPQRIRYFSPSKYYIPVKHYKVPSNSRLSCPTHLRLSIGFVCQTNCIYCYAEKRYIERKSRISLNRWYELIDEAKDKEILNIEIAGADPFADDIAPHVTAYVLRLGIPVFLSTKAAIMPKVLDGLIGAGLNGTGNSRPSTIQISVDSDKPKIADILTGVKDYLKRADENVSLCINRGVRVRIKSVLTNINHDAILPVINKYYALGVRFFQFVQCGRSYFRNTDDLMLSNSQKQQILDINEYLKKNRYPDAEIVIQTETGTGVERLTPEGWSKRSRCSGGYSSMTICPDGNVILCEQLPSIAEYIVGNVMRNNLLSVWNSKKLNAWLQPQRLSFLGKPCFDCEEFEQCVHNAGWCYRDALFAYGDMHTAPPKCPRQVTPARRFI
jgi:radical SAM protein with 4Fe4S-binding SPASM domain